jgi:hypothetical protein
VLAKTRADSVGITVGAGGVMRPSRVGGKVERVADHHAAAQSQDEQQASGRMRLAGIVPAAGLASTGAPGLAAQIHWWERAELQFVPGYECLDAPLGTANVELAASASQAWRRYLGDEPRAQDQHAGQHAEARAKGRARSRTGRERGPWARAGAWLADPAAAVLRRRTARPNRHCLQAVAWCTRPVLDQQRPGTLLSSDDFRSSVERRGSGHPVYGARRRVGDCSRLASGASAGPARCDLGNTYRIITTQPAWGRLPRLPAPP